MQLSTSCCEGSKASDIKLKQLEKGRFIWGQLVLNWHRQQRKEANEMLRQIWEFVAGEAVQGGQVVQVVQGWALVRIIARKKDVRLIGTLQGRQNMDACALRVSATRQLSRRPHYMPAECHASIQRAK